MPFYHSDSEGDIFCPFENGLLLSGGNNDVDGGCELLLEDLGLNSNQKIEFKKLSELIEHVRFLSHLLGIYGDAMLVCFNRLVDQKKCFEFTVTLRSVLLYGFHHCLGNSYPNVILSLTHCNTEDEFSFQDLCGDIMGFFEDFHAACDYVRRGDESPVLNGYKVERFDISFTSHVFHRRVGLRPYRFTSRWEEDAV